MAGKDVQATEAVAVVQLRPENASKKYDRLFLEIDTGQIKLPMFQREFVWDKEKSAKLIDSILKGYPIGTFILWKTRESLRAVKDIGNHKLPETPKGDYVEYILDGQQRITSLYAIRKGIRLTRDNKVVDYRDIYLDLDVDATLDGQIVTTQKPPDGSGVSVHDLLTKGMFDLFKMVGEGRAALLEDYRNRLTSFDFPTVTIRDYPLEIACDIFARINTGGKALTLFEIMVAMTYDEERDFDLAERFEHMLNGADETDKCLATAGFGTIPSTVALQAVAAIVSDSIRGKDILKISRDAFIDGWQPMVDAMFSAVDFIRGHLQVPVSQLLPYPALLIPLSYFFHHNGNRKPDQDQIARLRQFFYCVGWGQRYGGGTESAVTEDLRRMKDILAGRQPVYPAEDLVADADVMREVSFSTGSSYVKAVLCLLASQQPRNIDDHSLVILDNSNLKIASSRNYHHFFPKAFVQKKFPKSDANVLANITLIDAASNNKIRAQAPSKYIKGLDAGNRKLAASLRTHLIGGMKEFGIEYDDYELFLQKRASRLANELNAVLNPFPAE